MKIKQTIKQSIVLAAIVLGLGFIIPPVEVSAATCGDVTTSIISCEQKGGGTCILNGQTVTVEPGAKCADGTDPTPSIEATGVWGLLLVAINILTAGIGVAAVAGVVYGSVLYSAAGDSTEKAKKARDVITNVVIGVIMYALMYAGLNFIIPGGLFT